MSNLKWKPRNDEGTIGVPGKGFINVKDFKQEDLDNLMARAKNRKMYVGTFLSSVGLVKVDPQVEIFEEPVKEEPKEEKPKLKKEKKVKEEKTEVTEEPKTDE
jgi:hypothetical protein